MVWTLKAQKGHYHFTRVSLSTVSSRFEESDRMFVQFESPCLLCNCMQNAMDTKFDKFSWRWYKKSNFHQHFNVTLVSRYKLKICNTFLKGLGTNRIFWQYCHWCKPKARWVRNWNCDKKASISTISTFDSHVFCIWFPISVFQQIHSIIAKTNELQCL